MAKKHKAVVALEILLEELKEKIARLDIQKTMITGLGLPVFVLAAMESQIDFYEDLQGRIEECL